MNHRVDPDQPKDSSSVHRCCPRPCGVGNPVGRPELRGKQQDKLLRTWDPPLPYQIDLLLLGFRIRGLPGFPNGFGDLPPALRCGNPVMLGYLPDDSSGSEFLDDGHGVHLPSGLL